MLSDQRSHLLTALIAGIATVAVFAKSFTPYYLIGSTPIFVAACLLGLVLTALNWRRIADLAGQVTPFLVLISLLYAVVTANYFINSWPQVPITHLLGILIFHGIFLLFGFASAGVLSAVFAVLLVQGIAYVIIFGQFAIRFGDFIRFDGYPQDMFGLGPDLSLAIHQQVGSQMALAVLAAFGLALGRTRWLAVAFMPIAVVVIYRMLARTSILALGGSLALLAFGVLYVRKKRVALALASALVASVVLASALFYQYALKADIAPDAQDLISRTITEIKERPSGMRMDIWLRTWDRVAANPPAKLAFGRGIGAYPIDEGVGPPDWLLKKTEGARTYPHNIHLEMLYETGIAGLLIYTLLTLLPLGAAIKYWPVLAIQEKLAVSMYFFYFVSQQFSGAFAISYDFQFFLGLTIGIIGLKRNETGHGSAVPPPLTGDMRAAAPAIDAPGRTH
jgi:O-antigen ligase